MPELTSQSIPPLVPPPIFAAPPGEPPADGPPPLPPFWGPVPSLDSKSWEDFPVFRETFLMYVTPPGYAGALRQVGEMLYSILLETPTAWPGWSESATRTEMKAAARDLRHMQGFLRSVGQENKVSSLSVEDGWLSNLARKLAPQVGKLAGFIEKELAESAGEVQG